MFNNQFDLRETWREFELKSEGKNSFEKCIILIFGAVAVTLLWLAKKLHITYNEINVIVYYWIIPATWTLMLDYKIDAVLDMSIYKGFFPALTIALCCAWVGILTATFRFFSKWCDFVFRASQAFLCIFNRWGGNYILNSVIVCVLLPLIIYFLIFFI